MSLKKRWLEARRWARKAKDRYWGARSNLREVRKEIDKVNSELADVRKRIPHAQGGVLDDLRAKEAKLVNKRRELNRRKQKLAKQVKNREEIYERLQKKFKHLDELYHDYPEPSPGSSSGPGFSTPSRAWNPNGRAIPNWMIVWLDKSWAAGWRGYVASGVRTPEYSEQLCYAMCGAPFCPGRCAGRSSNHNMVASQGYPYGAIDVTDYYTFESVQFRIGSPLRNALPDDPVHFSVSGR